VQALVTNTECLPPCLALPSSALRQALPTCAAAGHQGAGHGTAHARGGGVPHLRLLQVRAWRCLCAWPNGRTESDFLIQSEAVTKSGAAPCAQIIPPPPHPLLQGGGAAHCGAPGHSAQERVCQHDDVAAGREGGAGAPEGKFLDSGCGCQPSTLLPGAHCCPAPGLPASGCCSPAHWAHPTTQLLARGGLHLPPAIRHPSVHSGGRPLPRRALT